MFTLSGWLYMRWRYWRCVQRRLYFEDLVKVCGGSRRTFTLAGIAITCDATMALLTLIMIVEGRH